MLGNECFQLIVLAPRRLFAAPPVPDMSVLDETTRMEEYNATLAEYHRRIQDEYDAVVAGVCAECGDNFSRL